MDAYKQAFLMSHGLHTCADIVDCDPIKMTVTFADGGVRQAVDCYTRVMGYHAAVASFNAGKQAEHRERKPFRESAIAPGRYTLAEGEGHD
jgi:hypothetical protein